jgi:Family of unknown function (DUF6502)
MTARRKINVKSGTSVSPALMHNLLSSVIHFMSKSGMTETDIQSSCRLSIEAMKTNPRVPKEGSSTASNIGYDTVAGAVLRSWHKDAAYIDEYAQPRPLKFTGRCPSFAALVREQDAMCDANAVISDMLSVGLIRKTRSGHYLPTAESATIGQMHPLAVDHVAKSVARMLETVYRNTDSALARTPLIERYAHVPDLDPSDAGDFAAFAQQQGAAYLAAIDDWLETRRVQSRAGKKRSSRDKVAAGVHLVAYLGDQQGYARGSSPRVVALGQGPQGA